jgi:hypothetical protein
VDTQSSRRTNQRLGAAPLGSVSNHASRRLENRDRQPTALHHGPAVSQSPFMPNTIPAAAGTGKGSDAMNPPPKRQAAGGDGSTAKRARTDPSAVHQQARAEPAPAQPAPNRVAGRRGWMPAPASAHRNRPSPILAASRRSRLYMASSDSGSGSEDEQPMAHTHTSTCGESSSDSDSEHVRTTPSRRSRRVILSSDTGSDRSSGSDLDSSSSDPDDERALSDSDSEPAQSDSTLTGMEEGARFELPSSSESSSSESESESSSSESESESESEPYTMHVARDLGGRSASNDVPWSGMLQIQCLLAKL